MGLDLSLLEESPVSAQPIGKPMDVPVGDIIEDPEQPRTEFSAETMNEMVASIKAKGKIISPISIRPHPDQPGKWILNHGARRLRGSILCGLKTIPAFIDELHDNYDQIIENIHRENLTPMELALFIKKRVDLGEKQKAISKRLGKDASVITQHLALINLPDCISYIYSSGKCRSPKTLYDLKCLYDKKPDEVAAWCESEEEVTRQTVVNLSNKITAIDNVVLSTPASIEPSPNVTQPIQQERTEPEIAQQKQEPQETTFRNTPSITNLKTKGLKAVLVVEINQRLAAVLLDKPPSLQNHIHIRYQDGSGDDEVTVDVCRIVSLTHV
jgi:ParB family chromosome partitioning protein